MNNLLTIEELAKILKVPKSWIYDRTRKDGPERIPHYKIGKYVRFVEQEVIEYLRIRCMDSS